MKAHAKRDFRIQRVGCERRRIELLQNLQIDEGAAIQQYLLHDMGLFVLGFCAHYGLNMSG